MSGNGQEVVQNGQEMVQYGQDMLQDDQEMIRKCQEMVRKWSKMVRKCSINPKILKKISSLTADSKKIHKHSALKVGHFYPMQISSKILRNTD